MTPTQVETVKQSFGFVAPISTQAGALFYRRLFELDPALRQLFSADIRPQSEKLMQTITVVVNSLDRLEEILPAVKALGARHVEYGVVDAHYDTVAAALLWTLEQGLGAKFTSEVREAWTAAYVLLANTMKAAAREAAAAAT